MITSPRGPERTCAAAAGRASRCPPRDGDGAGV